MSPLDKARAELQRLLSQPSSSLSGAEARRVQELMTELNLLGRAPAGPDPVTAFLEAAGLARFQEALAGGGDDALTVCTRPPPP